MSSVALPTKTSGFRPPIKPPVGIALDPFGDDPERLPQVLAESVRLIIRDAQRSSGPRLVTYRQLLLRRKEQVEKELQFERMIGNEPLPPLLSNFYSLDFLGEENASVTGYVRLLQVIDSALSKLERRIAALKPSDAPSDI